MEMPIQEDEIAGKKINTLFQTLLQFSRGNNLASNEYILVTDRNILSALSLTSVPIKGLEEAAAAIVIAANPEKGANWIQHSIFAGGHLWITALALGLKAIWEGLYQQKSKSVERAFASSLDIPEQYRITAIMGLWDPRVPIPKPSYSQNGSGSSLLLGRAVPRLRR